MFRCIEWQSVYVCVLHTKDSVPTVYRMSAYERESARAERERERERQRARALLWMI